MLVVDMFDLINLGQVAHHAKFLIETCAVSNIETTDFVNYFSSATPNGRTIAQAHGCDIDIVRHALNNPSPQNNLAIQELTQLEQSVDTNVAKIDSILTKRDPNYPGIPQVQRAKPYNYDPVTSLGKELADMVTKKNPKF